MTKSEDTIQLAHGSGGLMMQKLLGDLIFREFGNEILAQHSDSAILQIGGSQLAFTTDSFVIDPVFFPGGDIGKLAVCGTVNDLAVCGAIPLYLSVAFIIEEGFPLKDFETIVRSLALEAKKAGVRIVTGDTKVVNKGKCDKVFINTSGIGRFREDGRTLGGTATITPGDKIILSGTIGDHGMAILNARESFQFRSSLVSDCSCLNFLIHSVFDAGFQLKFMRDPTRGGVAAVLNELASEIPYGIEINEDSIPLNPRVRAMTELLGFDPLSVANEGKVVMIVPETDAQAILKTLQSNESGKDAAIIGVISNERPHKVILNTFSGGKRLIDVPAGVLLPRIC
ncbi:MAG: hydrogenase expression/formation protein HypE [Bacteroidetes bacterium]|nr:hydrogenase expression/formation protein HypE [Bacteroidota bacterium]